MESKVTTQEWKDDYPSDASRKRRKEFLIKWLLRVVCLFTLLGLGYCFRTPLLTGLANFWIVNEPPAKADAIVVLGGGLQYRPFQAAVLYHKGFAARILITDVRHRPTDQMGLTQPERRVTEQALLKQAVPKSAIVPVGKSVTTTFDEAVAVRDWVNTTGAKRLIIVTEIFHTRRARWIFRKVLRNTGTEILAVAAQPQEYQATNWWQNEEGVIAFQNEVAKMFYYFFKY